MAEQQIDFYNEGLAPAEQFVLPGGTPLRGGAACCAHGTRRAERLVVELVLIEPGVNSEVMIYLNRLSDLLFVFARLANGNGKGRCALGPGRKHQAADKRGEAGNFCLPVPPYNRRHGHDGSRSHSFGMRTAGTSRQRRWRSSRKTTRWKWVS